MKIETEICHVPRREVARIAGVDPDRIKGEPRVSKAVFPGEGHTQVLEVSLHPVKNTSRDKYQYAGGVEGQPGKVGLQDKAGIIWDVEAERAMQHVPGARMVCIRASSE